MKIVIVGMGKIGTVLFELGIESGHEVHGIDVRPPYTSKYNQLDKSDLVLVSVNTTSEERYETKNVEECLSNIRRYNSEVEVAIVSTCPPSFFPKENIAYNPLFIRQGHIRDDILNADFILIGGHAQKTKEFYKSIVEKPKFIEVGQKEAAIIKMAINGFLCLKVAYANMIGDFCVGLDLDPEKVLGAVASCRSVNPSYFRYGPGYGGPCLPIDNRTLADELENDWFLRVDDENKKHLMFEFEYFKRTNPDKTLIYEFDNISYKKGVPIIVASQRLALAQMLANEGYRIKIKERKEVCELVEFKMPGTFSFEEVSDG